MPGPKEGICSSSSLPGRVCAERCEDIFQCACTICHAFLKFLYCTGKGRSCSVKWQHSAQPTSSAKPAWSTCMERCRTNNASLTSYSSSSPTLTATCETEMSKYGPATRNCRTSRHTWSSLLTASTRTACLADCCSACSLRHDILLQRDGNPPDPRTIPAGGFDFWCLMPVIAYS